MKAAAAALVLATGLSGCAVAMPAILGGSTTPHLRSDVAAGAAARIAHGDVRASENGTPDLDANRGAVDATGVVPVVAARYGLGEHLDLGIVAAGTGLRFDVRAETVLRQGTTRIALVYGAGPSYGYVASPGSESGGAHRVGIEPIVSLSVDFGGLYDVWVGPRILVDGLVGRFEDSAGALHDARGLRLDLGGVFGIAAGFRRVHAFVELSAMHERWWGSQAGIAFDRHGLVLLPAFGLRLRI